MRYGIKHMITDTSTGLHLRVHVEASGLPEALDQAKALIELVQAVERVLDCRVEPYWKVPGQHRVWLRIVADDQATTFFKVLTAVSPKWDVQGAPDEPWAVWDFGIHGPALLPSARWAHLERSEDPSL